MKARIQQIKFELTSLNLDALLITDNPNISYLTKIPAADSWLLITRKKSYYVTDARYTLEVKKSLKSISVVEHQGSLFAAMKMLAKKNNIRTIGFDENHISVSHFKGLCRQTRNVVSWKPVNGLVESRRMIKDQAEISNIKNCLKLHELSLKYLKKIVKPGLTERDVFMKLEHFVKSRGADFSFPPIIASGVNSCYPHAQITDRKIRRNEAVLIDMGIDINGYKSDLTRMFYLGKIPNLIKEVHALVYQAQRLAINIIAPGVSVAEVDHQARNFLEKNKLAKYFTHSLGHGVGLEIHEAPRLSGKSKEILKEGMVVTVEPGVYLPDQFGIRIEDMVLVTSNGCKVISDNIN